MRTKLDDTCVEPSSTKWVGQLGDGSRAQFENQGLSRSNFAFPVMASLSKSDFLMTEVLLGKVYFSEMKASFGLGRVAGLTLKQPSL